jgi:hypothetical protein
MWLIAIVMSRSCDRRRRRHLARAPRRRAASASGLAALARLPPIIGAISTRSTQRPLFSMRRNGARGKVARTPEGDLQRHYARRARSPVGGRWWA